MFHSTLQKFSMMLSALTFLLALSTTSALFVSNDVVELNESNFDRVTKHKGLWFVVFYAPWCGHCQKLEAEWNSFASKAKDLINVGAVNGDQHSSLLSTYGVKGFPTILIFGENKNSPIKYSAARNAKQLLIEAGKQFNAMLDARSGASGSSRSSGSSSNGDVIELTDSNFERMVLNSNEPWLVEFYAPWCGHCKNLKPQWDEAATLLKGVIKLGALDATVHTTMTQKYNIQGYPTIKFFPGGTKSGTAEEYNGGRTAKDIVEWVNEHVDSSGPPPELVELTSDVVFKENCKDHPLCVLAVLPPLYDCQSACRNKYINLMKSETEKFAKQKWGWLWTEAMFHPELEKALDIGGSGYPALVVMHSGKMKRATMRGSFSSANVNEFLRTISYGTAVSLFDIKSFPTLKTVNKWDGKDAPVMDEEL